MALLCQTSLQILYLALLRQAPKPKQVAGLFKTGMFGQFVNVNAAIGKHAAVSIDIANAGIGGDNAFQTFSEAAANAGHNLSLGQIDYRCSAAWGGARGMQLSFIRETGLIFHTARE